MGEAGRGLQTRQSTRRAGHRAGVLRVGGPPAGPRAQQHHPGLERPQGLCHPAVSCRLEAGPPLGGLAKPQAARFMGPAEPVSPTVACLEASVTAGKKGFMIHSLLSPVPTTNRKLKSGFLWRKYKSVASSVSHRQAVRGFKAKAALGVTGHSLQTGVISCLSVKLESGLWRSFQTSQFSSPGSAGLAQP